MMWDRVVEAVVAAIMADETLVSIYGDRIELAGSSEHGYPKLEYRVLIDTENETDAPALIQFDQYTETYEDLVASERRLYKLFNRALDDTIGGLRMMSERLDGDRLVDNPNEHGYYGRAVRFRFTPRREQYSTTR